MPDHEGMNSNNFVVTKTWYEAHPQEVAFFLEVWDRVCRSGPQSGCHPGGVPGRLRLPPTTPSSTSSRLVREPFNEFTETVYLDQAWIEENCR